MKIGGLFILLVAWIAWIAGFASALALERHREATGVAATAAADSNPPKTPFAWRLNSVCLIDEHKSPGHVV